MAERDYVPVFTDGTAIEVSGDNLNKPRAAIANKPKAPDRNQRLLNSPITIIKTIGPKTHDEKTYHSQHQR